MCACVRRRPELTDSAELYDALWRYFQLDVPLDALYERWTKASGEHGRRMKVGWENKFASKRSWLSESFV